MFYSAAICSFVCRIFNHPNILPVLGACNQPPNLVIISQFMPFGSLYDVLHGETGTVTFSLRSIFAVINAILIDILIDFYSKISTVNSTVNTAI